MFAVHIYVQILTIDDILEILFLDAVFPKKIEDRNRNTEVKEGI